MKKYLLILCLVFLPQIALAGTQTYSTPGSYSFTVPSYGTLTVTVWAGGGGASNYYAVNYPGQAGGTSSFNGSVVAYGGATSDVCGFGAGAGGTSTGGDSNYTGGTGGAGSGKSVGGVGGNGANGGGSGGAFDYSTGHGLAGSQPGGGGAGRAGCDGAGGGGASVKTYASGQLTVGGTVSVVVGAGGVAGVAPIYYMSGAGAPGQVTITWTDAAPTCSVTFSSNPLAYGSSSTLTYSSTYATTLYINNIGYVSTSGGSTSVSPSSTTNYSCTATGPGGTGTQAASLTVTAPSVPTATITASSSAIYVGESTGIHATFSAGSGDTLTGDNIDSPVGTGLGASTNPDANKWYTFTPSSAGTYTFYARAKTTYYTSWTTYDTVDVVVTAAPACTLSLTPSTVAQGNSSTLAYSSSNATTFSISGIGSLTPNTSGSTSVSPSVSTTYTGSATAGGVTNTCSATLSVSCTPAYSCSSQTIQYTNAACALSDVTTCVSPAFCSSGSATCLYAPVEYVGNGNFTGHLQAVPLILMQGTRTKLHWNVENVSSCSVTGTNGDSYSGSSSPVGGRQTSAIEQQTIYTLSCAGLDGSSVEESLTVNILPVFNEQ